ncbi:MAG: sugar ABC transporter ATP-binding protein [Rhizobiaceae bacterium]
MHSYNSTQAAPRGTIEREIALDVDDLRKRYGSTVALDGVSLQVEVGAVHALLGENGAGKSTLVKMLNGLAQPDSGTIGIFGTTQRIDGPLTARALGIRTAFQEISLVGDLTVAQNLLLMEEPLNWLGMTSRRRSEEFAAGEFARLGLRGVDPRAKAGDLDLPTRQKIEIARSVSRSPRLLLLDEPTASLSSQDVQWLAQLIEERKAAGTTIIFISHRMQEVREFCTSLSVLRNGKCVGTAPIGEVDDAQVIEMMIGRSLSAVFPPKRLKPDSSDATPALSARSLSVGSALDSVSLDLWPGQVLGVGGLQGMGQRELFLALFGATQASGGEIVVNGRTVVFRSPSDAVLAGIGLVPEDRKSEGLFLEFDGRENLALPALDRFVRFGLVDQAKKAQAVLHAFGQVQVPPRAFGQTAARFSGGNQQKMVIARWFVAQSRILLLYDPTRGVDIGTKAEIYRLINDFAAGGGAVLFYSSDITELVNLCAEVLVLYRGRISGTLIGEEIGDTSIMRAALGDAHLSRAGEAVS